MARVQPGERSSASLTANEQGESGLRVAKRGSARAYACVCVRVSMTCPFNRWGSRELAVGEPGVPGEQGLGKSRSHFHQTTWRLHGSWQQPVHTLPIILLVYMQRDCKKKQHPECVMKGWHEKKILILKESHKFHSKTNDNDCFSLIYII